MIPHCRFLFIRPFLLFAILLAIATNGTAGDLQEAEVGTVLDGDTLVLTSGVHVRLLGLDAPEKGEAFAERARKRLTELTCGRKVTLVSCDQRDRYGRKLSTVWSMGSNVNRILLEEGLAVPMLIPPCGRTVTVEVLQAVSRAMTMRRGIYSQARYEVIHHEKAEDLIGRRAVVRGRIVNLHKGDEAWHLNFGKDWRTDFTAVLLSRGRSRFEALGMDTEDLVGSEVLVIGKVKRYNGPEIIVEGPEQIIPVE